jgi:hypothetical protein
MVTLGIGHGGEMVRGCGKVCFAFVCLVAEGKRVVPMLRVQLLYVKGAVSDIGPCTGSGHRVKVDASEYRREEKEVQVRMF